QARDFGNECVPVNAHAIDDLIHVGAEIIPARVRKNSRLFGRKIGVLLNTGNAGARPLLIPSSSFINGFLDDFPSAVQQIGQPHRIRVVLDNLRRFVLRLLLLRRWFGFRRFLSTAAGPRRFRRIPSRRFRLCVGPRSFLDYILGTNHRRWRLWRRRRWWWWRRHLRFRLWNRFSWRFDQRLSG